MSCAIKTFELSSYAQNRLGKVRLESEQIADFINTSFTSDTAGLLAKRATGDSKKQIIMFEKLILPL